MLQLPNITLHVFSTSPPRLDLKYRLASILLISILRLDSPVFFYGSRKDAIFIFDQTSILRLDAICLLWYTRDRNSRTIACDLRLYPIIWIYNGDMSVQICKTWLNYENSRSFRSNESPLLNSSRKGPL